MTNAKQTPKKELKGYCNCCAKAVVLLHDEELGESICKLCRSYDIRRKS
jgi:hypothetical protein